MLIRVVFSAIVFLSVLFLPFWVSAILILIGMAYFSTYYEALVLLLLSDMLYGAREGRLHEMVFVSFLIGCICLIGIEISKTKLKFYNK